MIQLCSGYWVNQMAKINEAVVEKKNIYKSGWRKQLVLHFTKNNFWKCIGCILLEVTYVIKGHSIWLKTETSVGKKGITPIQRNVCGKTDLLKVLCYLYHLPYCYPCH